MKRSSELTFYIVLAVALVTAGLVAWKMLYHPSAPADPVQTVPGPAVLRDLEGNYSMKMVSDGTVHYSTAVVKKVAERQYQIARITVYGPVVYGFILGEDATVSSVELGEGTVRREEKWEKTTIRFEKEDLICELSK